MIQLIHSMLHIGDLLAFKIRIIKLNYLRSVENKFFHYCNGISIIPLQVPVLCQCASSNPVYCLESSRREEWSKVGVIVWTGVADMKENSLLPPNDALYSYRNREKQKELSSKSKHLYLS